MKVKELITWLINFNPNAEVKVIVDGIAEDIVEDGWSGDDREESIRDIDKEKATAKEVYLIFKREVDNPNRCEKEKED